MKMDRKFFVIVKSIVQSRHWLIAMAVVACLIGLTEILRFQRGGTIRADGLESVVVANSSDPGRFETKSAAREIQDRKQKVIWRLNRDGSLQLPGRLGELATKDLRQALDYAESLEDRKASREAVLALLWASLAAEEGFVIDVLPYVDIPESDRAALVAKLVVQWSDPKAALDWVSTHLKGSAKGEMLGRCLSKMALSSPEDAVGILNGMGKGGERSVAATWLFSAWAGTSPKEALSVAGIIQDETEKNLLLEIAYAGLVRLDPKQAEQIIAGWTMKNSTEHVPQQASINLASHLALSKMREEGPGQALSWAQNLPEELGDGASSAILDNWSQRYPGDAADAFQKLDSRKRVVLAESFMDGWARRGPADAGDWLLSYPESRERVQMTASLIGIWGDADSEAAYSWLSSLKKGGSRDAGIRRLIVRERPENPEVALLWAHEISEPKSRDAEVKILEDNYFSDPN